VTVREICEEGVDVTAGYIAVKPMGYLSNGNGSCYGCDFDRDACFYMCSTHYRADHQDVIFIPAVSLKEAIETALEATICALSRQG